MRAAPCRHEKPVLQFSKNPRHVAFGEEMRENTYHDRFRHGRLKSVAEVKHPPLIVSKQNIFLISLQEHRVTHGRLIQKQTESCNKALLDSKHGIFLLHTFPVSRTAFRNFSLAPNLLCSSSSSLLKVQYFLCELLWNMAAFC